MSKEEIIEKEEVKNETEENTTNAKEDVVVEEVNAEEIDEFEVKYNEINDKYLRLYSEFENYRRRTAKEKLDLMASAGERVLSALIPIMDDMERAAKFNTDSDDIDAIKEGGKLVFHKFDSVLTAQGLKPIEVKAGDDFDVDFHEAITKIPAPNEDLKGKIVDVVEKGYSLNEKVVRFAKVVIGE